jgi:hypothetical protein|tara:strand:- start:321 stop:455 length:135 start_codon:yes stop_codon:yes gene_type:complete
MGIYKEKSASEVMDKPVYPITNDQKTKVRSVVTNFITYMKDAIG